MQSKKQSAIESLTNIAIGLCINTTLNMLVLPLFGLPVSISKSLGISVVYTVISFVRSYVIRRWFNGRN